MHVGGLQAGEAAGRTHQRGLSWQVYWRLRRDISRPIYRCGFAGLVGFVIRLLERLRRRSLSGEGNDILAANDD